MSYIWSFTKNRFIIINWSLKYIVDRPLHLRKVNISSALRLLNHETEAVPIGFRPTSCRLCNKILQWMSQLSVVSPEYFQIKISISTLRTIQRIFSTIRNRTSYLGRLNVLKRAWLELTMVTIWTVNVPFFYCHNEACASDYGFFSGNTILNKKSDMTMRRTMKTEWAISFSHNKLKTGINVT